MRTIVLLNYGEAIVDDEDFARVSRYRWWAVKKRETTYAETSINGYAVGMHRIVLGLRPRDGLQGDHKNGNGLDNRRDNLRIATRSDNQRNQTHRVPKHGYRGIYPVGRSWRAQIQIKSKAMYLGLYPTKEEAALAYDKAAREHYGEFALPNFPDAPARELAEVAG